MIKITRITVDDVRFPTSEDSTGSDAIHSDPDYSSAYVTIFTSENNLKGYGMAFTLGKGNDIVAECAKNFFPLFANRFLHDPSLNPISTILYAFAQRYGRDWGLTNAASVMMILPVMILFIIFQKKFIEGLTQGGLKA